MTESDLSELALRASRELDARRRGIYSSQKSTALAKALEESFASDQQSPALPLESIGLVSNVLENYAGLGKPATYKQLRKGAMAAARKLMDSNLSRQDISGLIDFCVRLYYAAREQPEIHDIPLSHPDLVTLG
jgi:hypothetical protein